MTTASTASSTAGVRGITEPWVEPGHGSGLLDVVRRRYLLKLLVRKELRVRYRGSVLGLAWSYVKPAVQYLVYFLALGVFLRQSRNIDHYAVYLFSGLVVVNFFSEAFANATRAVVGNAPLVKKIYLPRELFPVASVWVAGVHFVPQLVVLMIGALLAGWHPLLIPLAFAVLATVLIAALATGLGLLFGSLNVVFRDLENIVDLILMVVVWFSPVLYVFATVASQVHGVLLMLYQLNPITTCVELYHWAFWWPEAHALNAKGVPIPAHPDLPPHLAISALVATAVCAVVLALGQLVFRRVEGRFAQEL